MDELRARLPKVTTKEVVSPNTDFRRAAGSHHFRHSSWNPTDGSSRGGSSGWIGASYRRLQRRDFVTSLLGPVIVLGLAGIAGAWRRLTKNHEMMSSRERRVVRLLLGCGAVSASYSTVAAVGLSGIGMSIALPLLVLSVGGVLFLLGTPR